MARGREPRREASHRAIPTRKQKSEPTRFSCTGTISSTGLGFTDPHPDLLRTPSGRLRHAVAAGPSVSTPQGSADTAFVSARVRGDSGVVSPLSDSRLRSECLMGASAAKRGANRPRAWWGLLTSACQV